VQYVAIPTDGGPYLAHFGRARTMAAFGIDSGAVLSREDRINLDADHLDPAHHRVMLDLVRGCNLVIASYVGPPMVTSPTHRHVRVLGAPDENLEATLQAYLCSLSGGPPLEDFTPASSSCRMTRLSSALIPMTPRRRWAARWPSLPTAASAVCSSI
jgi:predicted Fe-Mo cluster-binding NifX family protein